MLGFVKSRRPAFDDMCRGCLFLYTTRERKVLCSRNSDAVPLYIRVMCRFTTATRSTSHLFFFFFPRRKIASHTSRQNNLSDWSATPNRIVFLSPSRKTPKDNATFIPIFSPTSATSTKERTYVVQKICFHRRPGIAT